ncbi:RsmE family RNA methyltransferase [Actinomarinicola tropica]|uniref:Ribosomal RNA small subunit methyltransferase E n=1 Tax=Actinomarinicola tropica TaxID=2789776 RepID=A0A5Q2RIN8_9ACTN|nr:RsmE family RNA methyltransferase [Actinomarinicola tropica]QGG95663.1 RsmE family RNA methyltransferase [Actinomarinicola tropica]
MAGEEQAELGPDGRSGPHVFVDDIARPAIGADDRHHLERVLRVRAGDPLTVSDGHGRWRRCRYGVPIQPEDDVHHVARRSPSLTVAFTPVKGDRPEWVVQKLTELGIDRILVLQAERSVVRWEGERAARQLERLARIAREASMQCRRCYLPEIDGPYEIAVAAALPHSVRADRGGRTLRADDTVVLVGPEGGWSDAERDVAGDAVALGDHILRAETAAVTAGALMTALRGGSVRQAG